MGENLACCQFETEEFKNMVLKIYNHETSYLDGNEIKILHLVNENDNKEFLEFSPNNKIFSSSQGTN